MPTTSGKEKIGKKLVINQVDPVFKKEKWGSTTNLGDLDINSGQKLSITGSVRGT